MNIAFLGEHSWLKDYWGTPLGIKFALQKLGHTLIDFGYDPNNCNLDEVITRQDEYDFILIFSCGPHPTLDNEIQRLRLNTSKKILLELGDEPQTFHMNQNRAPYVDAVFTPDLRCHKNYESRGIKSYWLTHWGDEFLFSYDPNVERSNRCVTTCGDRGLEMVSNRFGELFVNKRITPEENHQFYNSGTICIQKSRYNEITRRIMEAGGCKLAVVTDAISPDTGIYELFEHGKDIFYYRSLEEACHYIDLLLKDDSLRNLISENIYQKVNQFHRAETRAKQLISIWEELESAPKF
jgi:glycosyltransferase involved in cell wall biosynthesis